MKLVTLDNLLFLYRPSAKAILKHPFFWNREKQLAFFQVIFKRGFFDTHFFVLNAWKELNILSHFQDVSDRIEKEAEESDLLVSLQKDSIPVVRGDWKVHLGSELQEGEYRKKTGN